MADSGLTATQAAGSVSAASVVVPMDWIPLTGTDGVLTKTLRAIRANGAGTVTCKLGGSSVDRVMNFAAGETRLGAFISITSATATGLEGAL